jgi:hypothetical protein
VSRTTMALLAAAAAVVSALLGHVHSAAEAVLTTVEGVLAGLAAWGALPASKKFSGCTNGLRVWRLPANSSPR